MDQSKNVVDSAVAVGQQAISIPIDVVVQSVKFSDMCAAFFMMPVTKYWLSLIFRLLHLFTFGFALAL